MEERQGKPEGGLELLLEGVDGCPLFIGHLVIDLGV